MALGTISGWLKTGVSRGAQGGRQDAAQRRAVRTCRALGVTARAGARWSGPETLEPRLLVTGTPTGALEVWAGNTDLSGNPDALYNLDQNGYTQLGVSNAQNATPTFSTGGVHYNYFVLVSRGQVQVDSVLGSDATYLASIGSSGNTSDGGDALTGASDGVTTTIGTSVNDSAFAGYVEFANPGAWTSLTVKTGTMGLMLRGEVSQNLDYLPGAAVPYNIGGEFYVQDNGLITAGEVRNPAGVWYPLQLNQDSADSKAEWKAQLHYSSLAELDAALPEGTYTAVLNTPFGYVTTQFSYTRLSMTLIPRPIGLLNGATGVSTNATFQWNALNDPDPNDRLNLKIEGPDNTNTTLLNQSPALTATSYGPVALATSSNYAYDLSLSTYASDTNSDGFQFISSASTETDLNFRTVGTAAAAPGVNFTSVTLPTNTTHPGSWLELPVVGANTGGNAIGMSGGQPVSIQFEVVLAPTPIWGAAGTIVVDQESIGDPGALGGDSFSDGGPTVQIPASTAPGTYYVGLRYDSTGVIAGNTGNTTIWSTTQLTVAPAGAIGVAPPNDQTANPGQSQSFALGSFTQSNATAPFSIVVNWGDGSADSVFTSTSAETIPAASHTYAASGSNTVTVMVSDWNGAATGGTTFLATVVGDAAASVVTHLYHDVLGRDPDPNGYGQWVAMLHNNTSTPAAVATAFINSLEYRTNLVESIYEGILGRAADTDGLNYWVNGLGSGQTVEQLRSGFYGSDEYLAKHGGTTTSVVTAFYQAILNRAPDQAGLDYWGGLINSGTSRVAVAHAIMSSSTEGATDIVTAYYQKYLNRAPDPGGLAYWVALLNSGVSQTQILIGFVGSPEYYNRA
jgi:hypothetical protein